VSHQGTPFSQKKGHFVTLCREMAFPGPDARPAAICDAMRALGWRKKSLMLTHYVMIIT
jgi:hypothetical protein